MYVYCTTHSSCRHIYARSYTGIYQYVNARLCRFVRGTRTRCDVCRCAARALPARRLQLRPWAAGNRSCDARERRSLFVRSFFRSLISSFTVLSSTHLFNFPVAQETYYQLQNAKLIDTVRIKDREKERVGEER